MKRFANLYDQCFTRDSLHQAYQTASRGKLHKRQRFQFDRRLAYNLDQLHDELDSGAYQPRPYYRFIVHEPKTREICAPAFRDMVVQHAIYHVIYPIFGRTFIDQSFACRTGKGTHKAADYAQWALQQCSQGDYTLKMDVRKFFYRIDRVILESLLCRKIKDERLLTLMMRFTQHGDPVGIPIGCLLSQIYSLIYLNHLDHYIKRDLKVKLYCRYMDDFILFGLTRDKCVHYYESIREYLATELNLEVSKYSIAPVKKGVNFVGYRTWASKRFIRKHSLYKFSRAVKSGRIESMISIMGHARRTHSLKQLATTLKDQNHANYIQIPKIYRHAANS